MDKTLDIIIKNVLSYFKNTDISIQRRFPHLVLPKKLISYFAWEYNIFQKPVCQRLQYKNHTSITFNVNDIRAKKDIYPELNNMITEIQDRIKTDLTGKRPYRNINIDYEDFVI